MLLKASCMQKQYKGTIVTFPRQQMLRGRAKKLTLYVRFLSCHGNVLCKPGVSAVVA
jgi:hypothetical protein